MASLRSEILKLAHKHPEFRGDLLPLISVSKTAGPSTRNPGALEALNKLTVEADLPVSWKSLNEVELPVTIPNGFSSLFKGLFIAVQWGGNEDVSFGMVSWRCMLHTRPTYIGIGKVRWDLSKRKWQWSLDTGRQGYVD